jgi:stage II sporulation protein D
MRIFLLLTSFLLLCSAFGQQMRIGVLTGYNIKRLNLAYNQGSYSIVADSSFFGAILPNEFIEVSPVGAKVKLKKGTIDLGQFSKVTLIQNTTNTSLTLTSKTPIVKPRKYEDDFEITSNGKDLIIVNVVELNNYLSGVVESEGGGGRHLEYYKVQAVMSRTYALKYKSKHRKEGYDLCDRVHCQAYHSMMRFTPLIDSAVHQTNGVVMTDSTGKLVDAYFHANCGGQTCEPQYVWNESIPYLKSFKDTFCIYTKQATWETRIPKDKWAKFLIEKYNYPVQDSISALAMYTFDQTDRKAFYIHPVYGIPLRDLREQFQLKSTFFSCHPEGNDIVIEGRGFGHGVGLCQEGAMKMSKYEFEYDQILRFYFPGCMVFSYDLLNYLNTKVKGINMH